MSRSLKDLGLAAMMIDGVEIGARTHVVALGITTQGVKLKTALQLTKWPLDGPLGAVGGPPSPI